jgi:hypothetical protein
MGTIQIPAGLFVEDRLRIRDIKGRHLRMR